MKRIFYLILGLILNYYILFYNSVSATKLLNDVEIYNFDISDKYIVYEHSEIINENNIHYVSIFDIETKTINKILSNDGEYINSSMYFPSISDDGEYIVFTSRADNITGDSVNKCIDISDGLVKNCNNVYLYDVKLQKSTLIKYEQEYFNGDSYEAKISGNGNVIVFESLATNLVYNGYNCTNLNGVSNCINIYKYNILSNKISLVSTGKNNYGSNSNSVSPSISYDGRYITYQSNATNILPNLEYPKNCTNYITNEAEVCSNVYLVDTLNLDTKIISSNDNILFNNNSGNSRISSNGKYVAYESYSTDLVNNGKSHIYIYSISNGTNDIITKKDNILNNRDNYLEDISNDGNYLIYRTDSTNLDKNNCNENLYVVNLDNKFVSVINSNNAISVAAIFKSNLFYYDEQNLIYDKIDSVSPVIEKNQNIYVLIENILNIKDKVIVYDNLSNREQIDVYIDGIELLVNEGEYELNVTAIDEFSNIGIENVKVTILKNDNDGPIFSDINEIKILKGSSTLNLSNYIEAIDNVDGTTRIYIVDDGNLNFDETGAYKIKLMSKDSSNNVSYKEITVIVYDNYNFEYFYQIILIIGIIGVIIFSIIKVK